MAVEDGPQNGPHDGPPIMPDGQAATRRKLKELRAARKQSILSRRIAVEGRRQAKIAAESLTVIRQSQQLPQRRPNAGTRRITAGSKIRVGFLSPSILLGGAECWIASLMQHLDRERFEIAGVATYQKRGHAGMIERCRRRGKVISAGNRGIVEIVEQSDVVIVWGLPRWAKCLNECLGDRPTVLVSHGPGLWTEKVIAVCGPHCTHLAAVSEASANAFRQFVKQYWLRETGDSRADVKVILNGIDVDRCTVTQSRESIRREWGISDDEIAIGYVGRLSPEKNATAIAKVVSHLGRPFRAVYVGDGWRENEIRRAAQKICPAAVIRPAVEQVGNIYNALDCMMLVSVSEGFALALTEAWYCGVPTVATSIGAAMELEGEFGPLAVRVPVGASAKHLGAAVVRAMSAENRPLIENARRVVSKHFTAEAMARRWGDYLAGLFGR